MNRWAELSEITIDDMLRWESGELRLLAPGSRGSAVLDRSVSWAVTIRAALPVFPSLRGGEIVVAPGRLLTELEAAEMVGWSDIVRLLADHSVAGVVVDDPVLTGRDGVPVLVGSPEFVADAESRLNRELTERRARLYRLGSDLARALSAASMVGAGADALLSAAEQVAGRSLLLLGRDGRVLARSSSAPAAMPQFDGHLIPSGDSSPTRVATGDREWLVQLLSGRRLPAGSGLAVELLHEESAETARLALTQTTGALTVLLEQGASREADPIRERERIVADVLLGRRWSFDSLDNQGMLRDLDPASGLRVGLVSYGENQTLERIRSRLGRDRRWPGAALSATEYGLIFDDRLDQDAWRALQSLGGAGGALIVGLSEPVYSVDRLQAALAEARQLVRLAEAGLLPGPVVDATSLEQLGVYGLLYPLWQAESPSGQHSSGRLQTFAGRLLEPLERHDRQRNGELLPSLAAYLEAGGSLAEASARLGVHRNTLSYRLARINELLDRDLSAAETRFLFQLALTIRRMTDVLDHPSD